MMTHKQTVMMAEMFLPLEETIYTAHNVFFDEVLKLGSLRPRVVANHLVAVVKQSHI